MFADPQGAPTRVRARWPRRGALRPGRCARRAGAPGFISIAGRLDGRVAGCAWLRLDDEGVAQFCGAATVPACRRRGIQSALLRWRLAYARSAGCDVATVTVQPASRSQQNAQREGFHLLYARQLLVKL